MPRELIATAPRTPELREYDDAPLEATQIIGSLAGIQELIKSAQDHSNQNQSHNNVKNS